MAQFCVDAADRLCYAHSAALPQTQRPVDVHCQYCQEVVLAGKCEPLSVSSFIASEQAVKNSERVLFLWTPVEQYPTT